MAIISTPLARAAPAHKTDPSISQHTAAALSTCKPTSDISADAVPAANLSLGSLTPLSLSLSCAGGPAITLHEQHIGTLLGSIVWPGGRYLASYLQRMHAPLPAVLLSSATARTRLCQHFSLPHSFLRGKRVIELGSGTGIVGIVAARCLPATLVLTDLPELLPLLSSNLAAATKTTPPATTAVHCLPLTWSTTLAASELTGELGLPFDVMLLSDVVYDAFDTRQSDGINNHHRLFHTLHYFTLLSPTLTILLTYTARREEEAVFFELLRVHGYCWTVKAASEVVPDSVDAEDRRVDFFVIWRNECVSGEMHKHVKDRRLSAWVTEERSRQDDELQRKLKQRTNRYKLTITTSSEQKR